MALNFLIDYLTGQLALVMNITPAGPGPVHGASLLLETGDYLLLETGDTLLLE